LQVGDTADLEICATLKVLALGDFLDERDYVKEQK
jgi:hypothetical protein